MSRNQLKRFPTAILRRGMAHFHPSSGSRGSAPVQDRVSWNPLPLTDEPVAAPVDPIVLDGDPGVILDSSLQSAPLAAD